MYGGDMYIAAMTIINSVREVIHMPVSGVGNGAQPVMSFNYGAKEYGRVKQTIRYTAVILLVYTLFAWGMTMLFPNQFVMIFNKDAESAATYGKIHAYLFLRIFLHGISIHRADNVSGTWKIKAGNLLFHVKEGDHCCAAYVFTANDPGNRRDRRISCRTDLKPDRGLACLITMYVTVYLETGGFDDSYRQAELGKTCS